jgi:signal transduction histidine kinase
VNEEVVAQDLGDADMFALRAQQRLAEEANPQLDGLLANLRTARRLIQDVRDVVEAMHSARLEESEKIRPG